MQEVWKPIIIEKNGVVYDYTNKYEVSNMGRVRSLNYKRTGEIKILKPGINNWGYLYVNLCQNGEQKPFSIHRLVATMFIPNPNNLPEVNHISEVKTENFVENLEWVTPTQNVNHGTRNERHSKKMINKQGAKKVVCLETGEVFESAHDVQRKIGLTSGNVCRCCKGKRKTAGGYHWMYLDDYMREQ